MKTCQLSRSYQYHATEYKDNAILLKLKSFPILYSKTKEIQVFSYVNENIIVKICLFQKNALYLQRLILKYDYGRA